MTRIDMSKLITADAKAAAALEQRRAAARMECRRRILAVCDETAQINLAAAVAAGLITGAELETYRAGLAWVDAMRAAWPGLAEADADIADDVNWPPVPAGVVELANGFNPASNGLSTRPECARASAENEKTRC